MAIKGKSKKRGGGVRTRGALPPKPVIVERKLPFLQRKAVKRTIIGVVVFAAVLGGLRTWHNVVQSNALAKYGRELNRAEGLLNQHLDSATLTSMPKNSADFASTKISAVRFHDLGGLWEKDFTDVKTKVAALKPPKQLGDAQALIVQGIDDYIGVARLYQVAADARTKAEGVLADAGKAKKGSDEKKKLEAIAKTLTDQVQVLLLHADEWRQRAERELGLGRARLDDLAKVWHVKLPVPATSSNPAGSPLTTNPGLTIPGQNQPTP